MKKLSFFIAICMAMTVIQAQSYWSLSGNSTSGSNFIGTTNSNALNFKTNGTSRMTLSASQAFLGIGTSSPDGNLHINSTYRSGKGYQTDLHLTNSSTGGAATDGFRIRQLDNIVYFSQLEKANLFLQNNGKGFVLDTNGYFGFNTSYPLQRIHVVDGNIMISRTSHRADGSVNGSLLFGGDITSACPRGDWGIEYVNSDDEGFGLNFWRPASTCHTGFNYALFLADNGNIGIGTNNPQAKLSVDGRICAKEVRVSLSGSPCWPDYVFSPQYDLMPLGDLKSYVQEHRHLPGIPSAAEVEENGVELGATTEQLLQKIEEMTLYILQLEDRLQKLESGKGGAR